MKQFLPKEFVWSRMDNRIACYWLDNSAVKRCAVKTIKEAQQFIGRAAERNVAAYAAGFVKENNEAEVFSCSFGGQLKKFYNSDPVNLSIGAAYYLILHQDEKTAKAAAEQWKSDMHCKGLCRKPIFVKNNMEKLRYEFSYFDKAKNKFFGETFASMREAIEACEKQEGIGNPVRICEHQSWKLREVYSKKQSIIFSQGAYALQILDGSLPVGELPYFFYNDYLVDEMIVKDGVGEITIYKGDKQCVVYLEKQDGGAVVNVCDFAAASAKTVKIVDNPIIEPWLAKLG